ncbi:TIGR03667 family PPOX class F420-dependent oxidoreductase [Actinocrinis puniceicyclus]|uniref:TIGR03667 family PPOX class F420-dependent oxidoreductase n=1 Tax=Actinocrinis puniceicyclus TaxID=977794 RepID=A0A8J8BE17_9ACTN|nr:TIGR03667 family PPOX class F420-dependent oxidoreductase [Actinocrinis puniceicyclus]MBS2964746.1 TIGR03667 family PPOX class F420-dependent oxidoreductase [Actinocrinis puniceicyclus]
MTNDVLPDSSTTFGRRVRERLAEEVVLWLTTVGADGTPQPNPVWFLWEGEDTILVYNRTGANRIAHVKERPRVSLNFDGNGSGGDIVVLTGTAELLDGFPLASEHEPYMQKYAEHAARAFGQADDFASKYPVAMRIRITRVR